MCWDANTQVAQTGRGWYKLAYLVIPISQKACRNFLEFFSNFLNFWWRTFWKWRPSWKIRNMITLLHNEVHLCGKFGFDRLSGFPVRRRTKWPQFDSFGRHLPKKPEVGKKFQLQIHNQRTRFTQLSHFQEDPTNFNFWQPFWTAAILKPAAIFKIPYREDLAFVDFCFCHKVSSWSEKRSCHTVPYNVVSKKKWKNNKNN